MVAYGKFSPYSADLCQLLMLLIELNVYIFIFIQGINIFWDLRTAYVGGRFFGLSFLNDASVMQSQKRIDVYV